MQMANRLVERRWSPSVPSPSELRYARMLLPCIFSLVIPFLVEAVTYDEIAIFDLKAQADSVYTPTYPPPAVMTDWGQCPNTLPAMLVSIASSSASELVRATNAAPLHSKGGRSSSGRSEDNNSPSAAAVRDFQAVLDAPLEALENYYVVITEESFLLDHGGAITVSLNNDGMTLSTAKFRSYVDNYVLPVAASSSSVNMGSLAFFLFNQPRLHCLYNAPVLFDMLENLHPSSSRGDSDGASLRAEATAESERCCSGAAAPSHRAVDARADDSASSAAATCSCDDYMPGTATLRPPSTPLFLTESYMRAEANVQVMVFDAETWFRLTDGAAEEEQQGGKAEEDPYAAGSGQLASAARWLFGFARKKKKSSVSAEHLRTATASQEASRRADGKREEQIPYNLMRDPAKICSAPALYTIPLAPLISAYNYGNGEAAGTIADYSTPASSPNISHNYPPVRVVVVVAQCSAIPLTVSLTITLTNNQDRNGSGQYFYSSVMYFVFMVGYAIILVIFLVMIVRCESRHDGAVRASEAATAAATAAAGKDAKRRRERAKDRNGESEDDEEEEEESGERHDESPSTRSSRQHRHRRGRQDDDDDDGPRTRSKGRTHRSRHREDTEPAETGSEDTEEEEDSSSSESTYSGHDLDLDRSEDGERRRRKREGRAARMGKDKRKQVGRDVQVTVSPGVMRFFHAMGEYFQKGFGAFQAWWLASHIDIMFPSLQWILLVVIVLKCLIAVLRAAELSLLSGMQVVQSSYALPTVSVVLSVCASSIVFTLEVLVGLGWGLAFSALSTGKIVILSLACMCGFIVAVATSTCPITGWSDSFTANKYMRAEASHRCRSINYTRVAVETFFHFFNAIMMVVVTSNLGKIVVGYVVSPEPPLSEEAMAYFYKLQPSKDTAGPRGPSRKATARGKGKASNGTRSSERDRRAATTSPRRSSTDTGKRSSRSHHDRHNRGSGGTGTASGHRRRGHSAGLTGTRSRSRRRQQDRELESRYSINSSSSNLSDSQDSNAHKSKEAIAAAAEKRRNDAVQIRLMKLYLRYRSMRVPFCFVALFPVLFLIFSFTFFDYADYYVEIFFNEISSFYLFCFIILFMRHDSFYC